MSPLVELLSEVIGVGAPLLIAAAYLKRAHTLAAEGRPVPHWRQLSFAIGIVVIALAVGGPIEGYATKLVLAHMVQHLLLADLASLLLVLGLTGPLLRPILALPVGRYLRFLAHPVVAITVFTANLFLWHVPALYQAVTTSVPLHELEHLSFIATGCLLWMPLFGPMPTPSWFGKGAHVVYAAGIWLPAMVLANVLMWAGSGFYPHYAASAEELGIAPVADQSTAGAILMAWCTVLALSLFAWAFLRWAREDSERQDLLDLADAQGFELSSERAERAVAAGRGAVLRERIETAHKR
ncbi:MAG: cytochrome c oxidase assembly protein [Actinobacteria bacterium]|nr:cytochrome c oxidase assembly protein [Actinomycetota bacterium]